MSYASASALYDPYTTPPTSRFTALRLFTDLRCLKSERWTSLLIACSTVAPRFRRSLIVETDEPEISDISDRVIIFPWYSYLSRRSRRPSSIGSMPSASRFE
ncbi:hypothetical protein D3C77_342810 [compost metagenome]